VNEDFRDIAAPVLAAQSSQDGAPEAYFVGGCVRDLLLGDPVRDLDLVVRDHPFEAGKRLARKLDGHVFWLREEESEQAVRVILPGRGNLHVDFTPLRGSIEEDLLARDLTINAMAVPAAGGLAPDAVVLDPAGGRNDIAGRQIRFVSEAAPVRDPLRTLRALRFRWKLGFELAPETRARVRECAGGLAQVSGERIRDELFQLLGLAAAPEAFAECLELGLGPWALAAEAPAVLASRSPERMAAVLALLAQAPPDLTRLLQEEPTEPRTRRELLLWAAALEPLGPAMDVRQAARRLALSRAEREIAARALAAVGPVCDLIDRWPVTGRVRMRTLRRAEPAAAEAVLLAAAAQEWQPAHAELLGQALQRHFWPEPPLLTGLEVMQAAGLEPGPHVGQLLEEVEELRADGLLRTPQDAVRWLRQRAQAPVDVDPARAVQPAQPAPAEGDRDVR
jgi:tRNA nucleotidyltransferase/poly(A) polymerase